MTAAVLARERMNFPRVVVFPCSNESSFFSVDICVGGAKVFSRVNL